MDLDIITDSLFNKDILDKDKEFLIKIFNNKEKYDLKAKIIKDLNNYIAFSKLIK